MINILTKRAGTGCLLLLLGLFVYGQEQTLNGRIVNTSNEPVSDVTVSFEGSTSSPAVTDTTGQFELSVPTGPVWLIVSPIGTYKEKKIFLDGRSEITIFLAELESNSVYDEVLYLGQPKPDRNITASIYRTSPAGMSSDLYESVDQKLQGRVPGLFMTGTSGMPGSGTFMLMRGLNSINTNSQPLVIVDGIPLETPGLIGSVVDGFINHPLSAIDVMDISNVTIIKDGAALTSYGVKGSNGVILIETLKPSETNTSIDFQLKVGASLYDRTLPTLNTPQYKSLAREVITTSPWTEEAWAERYPGLFYIPSDEGYLRYSHNTTWQDEVFRNGLMQDAYLTVKGGDAIARYGLSVGYLNHQGLFDNTKYQRFNTRFVGTFNVFSWLRMYVSANLVSANADYKESALVKETSPLLTSLHKSPQMYPYAYDQNGKLLTTIDEVGELGVSNPRAVMDNYFARNANYRFLTSFRIEGDISKHLKWNSILGLNINDIKEKVFMPNLGMQDYLNGEAYNISQSLNNLLFGLYNDNFLSYSNLFSNIHAVDLSGGVRWQTNRYQADWGVARNSSENDEYTTLQSGEFELRDISGDNGRWNWLSNYLNLSYGFKDRYLLDAAVSMDFSTRTGNNAQGAIFIDERPFGLFYSVGGAWRVSGESFMSGLTAIEDLKLRVNYGTSGNDDIGNYNSYPFYTIELYREASGMVPGGFPNRYLTFESMAQISTGVDLGLYGNRLMLSGNYYQSSSKDLLIYEQLNSFMGYDIFPSNSAALDRKGYEIGLYSRLLRTGDFSVDLSLNISHYNSTITEIPEGEVITDLPGGGEIINRVGSPVNSFYGFEYNGVFSTQADATEAGLVNEKGIPFGPGDAIFTDFSGPDGVPDHVINEYDKIILGSASPDYYGGASLDIYFKRFHLEMYWQFVYGNEAYNFLRYQNERMTDLSNQSSAVLNRWVTEGQVTDIPRALWDDPVGNSAFSSRWIEDGSFARLKQLTLSYEIPEGIGFFQNLKVFITGSNLFTATNYLSYDPEFAYSFDSKLQGIDYGMMPMGRKIMVGVKFGL